MLTKKDFNKLLHAGLSYRYSVDDWESLLLRGGKLYPSPYRRVVIGGNSYIDELIQPLLKPVALTAVEISDLERLAKIWERVVEFKIQLVTSGLLDDHQFGRYIVPAIERNLILHCPGYSTPASPFIRFDLIRASDGFKIIDINCTRPAGVGDAIILDAMYQGNDTPNSSQLSRGFCRVIQQAFQS